MDDVSNYRAYLNKKKKMHVPQYEIINLLSSGESKKHLKERSPEKLNSPVHPTSASTMNFRNKLKKLQIPPYLYDEINLLSSKESTKHVKERTPEKFKSLARPISASTTNLTKQTMETSAVPNDNQDTSVNSTEPNGRVKMNSAIDLKDSTRKLLCLLEDIQTKTLTMNPCNSLLQLKEEPKEMIKYRTEDCVSVLRQLHMQTEDLKNVPNQNEDDDCSIFKRLTRKCNCLNHNEYNDFVINFNQKTKYFTNNTTGEIFKNLRIVKKFLYMGGEYCRHALLFLNEGLDYCSYSEKVEITQGCVQADMCNVFEADSIVTVCISWPFKYNTYGDSGTQELAAAFLNNLSQFEEGRRYLLYTSKITSDIKKVLKKRFDSLTNKTLDYLETTLEALSPKEKENTITDNLNKDDGYGAKIIYELKNYRKFMTLNEITTCLNLLFNYSNQTKGIKELTKCINSLVELFQEMLIGYDDSKMNIIITKILNNLLNNTLQKEKEWCPKILRIANVGTEAIEMKHKCLQSTYNPQAINLLAQVRPLIQDTRHKKKSHKIKSIKDFASKMDKSRVNVIIVPKDK